MYLSLDIETGGELRRLSQLPLTVTGLVRRFGIGEVVRGRVCRGDVPSIGVHCRVGTLSKSYWQYSRAGDSLLACLAHGTYRKQRDSPIAGYDSVPLPTTNWATPSVVQHDSGEGSPSSVESLLDFGNENTPFAAALSAERPPLSRTLRTAELSTIS